MGWFDFLRPAPRRSMTAIARELAVVTFELHPGAAEVAIVVAGARVVEMTADAGDVASAVGAVADRGAHVARLGALAAELARAVPVSGSRLTVRRDHVVWLPSMVPFPRLAGPGA